MRKDFVAFYAGQCFGTASRCEDAYGSDCFGDDLDLELEEDVDAEVFGKATGAVHFHKLEELLKDLKRCHAKGRRHRRKAARLEKRLSRSSKPKRMSSTYVEARRELAKCQREMKIICKKIMACWHKRNDAFKKMWTSQHHGDKRTPAQFIAKYGPHTLQF